MILNGVKFGNYHSWRDFGLLRILKEIGSPPIKTKMVEVDGSSVVLDYTEAFGDVEYGQRPLSFGFKTIAPQSEFMDVFSQVQNALHGQRMNISLDEDADHYYSGRITVLPFTNEKAIGNISIECECEPWKYKKDETVVTKSVSGSATIILSNSRKKVVPTIKNTADMTIEFNGYSGTYKAGTFIIPELELIQGENIVTVSGSGKITFTYREGSL